MCRCSEHWRIKRAIMKAMPGATIHVSSEEMRHRAIRLAIRLGREGIVFDIKDS